MNGQFMTIDNVPVEIKDEKNNLFSCDIRCAKLWLCSGRRYT